MVANIYCIVATYNAEPWIDKCLGSIFASTIPCTVVVVDNHSSDHTVSLLKSGYPEVLLVENRENIGFGRANNIGIKRAYHHGADYFFLLNQDAWVEKDTIEKLVMMHRQNPEYGILSPVQWFDKDNIDKKFRSYVGKFSDETLSKKDPENKPLEVRFANAATWLVSRNCIDKVGLFSPLFYHYAEDLNYVHRCRYKGIKIGVVPGFKAFHERKQVPPPDKDIPLRKLLARDESYCLGILLNINHTFVRQSMFLFFNTLKEIIKSLFLLRFIKIPVLLLRIRMSLWLVSVMKERKSMKQNTYPLLFQEDAG